VSGSGRASSSALALLRRFWRFARPSRGWIAAGAAAMPVVAAATALRPLVAKHAIDTDLPSGDAAALGATVLGFVAIVFVEFGAQALQVYALQRAGHATVARLRRHVFEHVLRLPARYFDRVPVGTLLSRTTSDVEALSETLSFGVFTILTDLAVIVSIVAAMFALDARLAAITLALAPALVVIVRVFSAALRKLQLETRRAQGVATGFLAERLAGAEIVKVFDRADDTVGAYETLGRRYLRATQRANVYDALLYAVMDGIAALAIAILVFAAAPDVAAGAGISVGLLYAFVDYLQRIFVPIREFSGKLATIQRAAASLERIYGLLDEPAEDAAPAAVPASSEDPLAGFRGGVRAEGLRFSYGDEPVLCGVDLAIEPGQVVAVVGRTGSGKSTLARLLVRLYDGYEGSLSLCTERGPVQVRDVPPALLRRRVAMVPQDVFLFDESFAFNVALGPVDDTMRRRIERALEAVGASDLVARRGGLDAPVGERGERLSAGEKQLIAFARVLVRSPDLVILDEATASVDSLTEARVQRAMERVFAGRTVLVIAHRLSTVQKADLICVFDRGRIVERGTHAQLLTAGGVYARLVASELVAQDEPGETAPAPAPAPLA